MIPIESKKEKVQLKVRVEKNTQRVARIVAQAERLPIQEIIEQAILAYCLPRMESSQKILEIRRQAEQE